MKIIVQIGVILGVCLLGEITSALLPFAFPASVISMILLFLLLFFGLLKIGHIQQKADFLLKNMAFFFIPAGVGIMEQFGTIKDFILPLLLICLITTVLTFAATTWTIKGVLYLQNRLREGKRHG